MIGGSVSCVFWYVLGYLKYQSFHDFIWGVWPCLFGSAVSLVLVIVVSKLTTPAPREVMEIFFDDFEEDEAPEAAPVEA